MVSRAATLLILAFLCSSPLDAAPIIDYVPQQLRPESAANVEFRNGISALIAADLDRAEQAFTKATSLDSKAAAPLLGLADVALRRGSTADAESWLRRASIAEPDAENVQIGWARLYRVQGRFADAERALLKVSASKPSVAAFTELGDLYLANLGNKTAALDAYRKAVQRDPTNAFARQGLGVTLAANGQVAAAIEQFEQVARISPKDAEPLRMIGRLHAEQHNYDEAGAALRRALERDPTSVAALADQGDVFAAQRKWPDAARSFETAAAHDPQAPLFVKAGLAYQLSNQAAKAEAAYKSAIERDANSAEAHNNLAVLATEQSGRAGEAVSWAQRATEIAPSNANYLDTLGWAQRANGDLGRAVQTLERASRLPPPSADTFYHLGVAYADQGKGGPAADALQRALEINPRFAGAADAQRRLKELGR